MSDESTSKSTLGQLLERATRGDSKADADLFALLYDELHRIAERHCERERKDITLQPTALVHEAWLRLAEPGLTETADATHFIALASTAMRRILVDRARQRGAEKRGGGRMRTTLQGIEAESGTEAVDLIALEDALAELEERNPRQAKVVELRFFGGLENTQVATTLAVSLPTVERDFRVARAFLLHRLGTA